MKSSQIPPGAEDKAEFDSAVESNLGLVYKVAKLFSDRGLEFDDLVQIGSIGLIKAVKRFDKSFGVCFSTYAVPMISGEIRRFLRDDSIIKISRTVKENAAKGRKAIEEIKKETGREPTISEISSRSKVSSEDLIYAFEACMGCESIDAAYENGDSIITPSVSCEETTIDKIYLKQAIDSLKPKERQVIILRYMMDKTQSAAAKMLGISQVQVSRIEKQAIMNMRSNIEN